MTRIAALNEFPLGSSDEEDAGPTREALEAEATKTYNRGIKYLALCHFDQAYDQFQQVLQNPLIEKAYWPDGVAQGGILPQDLALKYACLKNLGNLSYKRGDYDLSVEYYMEAVRIDRTEITLWHRLGASAIKLRDFELALVAFQEGYNVNPKHWPCLDQLLSVLFILRSYMDCLALAAITLERDPGYIKALSFKDKIFEIQPSLREEVKYFVPNSSVLFKEVDYDKVKGDKFIATCEELRPVNKSPKQQTSIPLQCMRKPVGDLTWDNLGQSLLATYDALIDEDGAAFAGRIDVHDILSQASNTTRVNDDEDLGVTPLDAWNKDDLQTGGKERTMRWERNSVDSLQGNPVRIPFRRRTIELGESQDSFRVSEKRKSLDSDVSRPEDTKSDDSDVVMSQKGNAKEVLENGGALKEEGKSKGVEERAKDDDIGKSNGSIKGNQGEDLDKVKTKEISSTGTELKLDSITSDVSEKDPSVENAEKANSELENTNRSVAKVEKVEGDLGKSNENVEKAEGELEKSNGNVEKAEGDLGMSNENVENVEKAEGDLGKSNENVEKTKKAEGELEKSNGNVEKAEGDLGKSNGNVEKTEKAEGDLVKSNGNIEKVEREVENSSTKSDGVPSVPVSGGENDNDFQGFTNSSAYRERHMKLVQGKNAIEVQGNGDLDVNLDNSDAQEMDSPVKSDRQSREVKGSDIGSENEVDGSSIKAKEGDNSAREESEKDQSLQSEEGEQIEVPNASSGEGEAEPESQETNSVQKVDAENMETDGNRPEEKAESDEQIKSVEGNLQGDFEEQLDPEANENPEDAASYEDGRHEGFEDGNAENVARNVVAHLGNMNMAAASEAKRANDELNKGNEAAQGDGGENDLNYEGNEGEENMAMEGDNENEAAMDANASYHEGDDGIDNGDMMNAEDSGVTETEAAVNALKGIMALQPTEILGLPEPEFDYENEYAEYFDGGVYEEEEDDMMHAEDQGEEEENQEPHDDTEQEEMQQGEDSSQEDVETLDEEEEMQQGSAKKDSQSEASKNNSEKCKSKEIPLEGKKEDEGIEIIDIEDEKQEDVGRNLNQSQRAKMRHEKDNSIDKTVTDDSTTTDATGKPVVSNQGRKSKRSTKRGLERELEQLDYWGRRQERDAKRRRRTISTKLLGGIEEAEYLTWGDLLRSFVPGPLLNVSEDDKKKKEPSEVPVQSTVPVTGTIADVNLVIGPQGKKEVDGESTASKDKSVTEEIVSTKPIEVKSTSDMVKDVKDESNKVKDESNTVKEESNKDKDESNKVNDGDTCMSKQREETMLSSSLAENSQVQAFLMQYECNGGILHLLQMFLKILMKRYKLVWPVSVAKMFTQIYPRVRNHVTRSSPLKLKESWQKLKEESLLSLTHWELCCSLYQASKLNSVGSSVPNPFIDNPSHLEEDVFYLVLMLGRGDVWVEETPQFHTRLRWLQSQIKHLGGQPEESASYLELLLTDLERLSGDETTDYICNRARVETDRLIVSNAEVKRQLNVLQRSHMLEQVVDNYTDSRYRIVADLLTSIFHEPLPKSRPGVTLPSRQTQLAILVDSLYRLSDYKNVIYWGSFSLTEALMRYNRAEADEEKNRWAKTLLKITDTMNNMLMYKDTSILKEVDRDRLAETVSSLINMLVVQLEKPQNAVLLPFETLIPWILLHRILSYEESIQDPSECRLTSLQLESTRRIATSNSCDVTNGGKIPQVIAGERGGMSTTATTDSSSVTQMQNGSEQQGKESETPVLSKGPTTPFPSTLFLITAHDELGKHSWCCYDDGIFLLYCLEVLLVELRRPLDDQHRQLLHHTLEQVTFCLYSHPSKRTKHKHLRDHGVPQIAFSWDIAVKLYEYYKPRVLPDFQTSLIASITGDAAVLFKRIIALLPDEAKCVDQTKGVEAYINGEVSVCNYTPFRPPIGIIKECFYLLGDYFFKSKEWTEAIEYYKLDLSINKERLESWAPLGLSMKAMLETQLTTCEIIKDEEAFFSLAKAAVQCLRQALKLDPYHTNLWVEFGGLVYMVHSHASRLLKQELNPDISLETFDMLEKFKNEMLDLAENCFTKALSLQEETSYEDEGLPDERWLHCYMLGKVSEKKNCQPHVIIQCYLKAAHHLHNIGAKYPVRINYNSPQEYSVEALEMYYRIHAYILKYLHQKEGRDVDPDVTATFTKCLGKLEAGHFRNCREKKPMDESAITDLYLIEDPSRKKRPLEDQETLEPPAKKFQSETSSDAKGESVKDSNVSEDKSKEESLKESAASDGKDKKESDDEIQVVEEKVVEKKDHYVMISKCLSSLRLCLSRFQEHYKTMYRLAHYYHTSKFHKDNTKAQNYLLGTHAWQNLGYMPVNGLFNERKIWMQQPRNSNFFHGIWRVPNDEIDRPGSFAAHMYRCVSLTLDILPQVKDFFMTLQIGLALRNSPDKDKKYLRDNERELLSEHATQVGLQAMKDKFKGMFGSQAPVNTNRHLKFLLDVYRCYKVLSKHLPGSEPHFAKMLTDAYACYKEIKVENRSNVLREADVFCHRHQYLHPQTPAPNPPSENNDPESISGSSTPPPTVARRGRPPLTGRGRGRGRGSTYSSGRTVGDMLAVQQAYKIYENLISTQTLLNKHQVKKDEIYSYQKQLQVYQSQLMKYLQIPSVSQYFQASLQNLGTSSTKLPPPPVGLANPSSSSTGATAGVNARTVSNSSSGNSSQLKPSNQASSSGISKPSSQPDQQRPALGGLSARAHGISITSVTGKVPPSSSSQQLKPNMSVTFSPVKSGTGSSTLQNRDVSVVPSSQMSSSKSATISPSKADTGKLSLPASTTVKPVTATSAAGSTTLKPGNSVTSVGGSTTLKAVTSSTGGSTTVKPVLASPSGTTTISKVTVTPGSSPAFKPSTSAGSSFKSSPSSGSSVPKLPAGTTLTRPSASPSRGTGPRPQLQANARPIKSPAQETVVSVKKVTAQVSGSSSIASTSKSGSSVSMGRPSAGFITKTLPKDMVITPTPRVKPQHRPVATPRPVSSPYFRAFEASLGLTSNKSPDKGVPVANSSGKSSSQGQTSSTSSSSGRIPQLSTQDILKMAYGNESIGQASASRPQQSGSHKQTPSSVPSHSGQFSKSPQQPRSQSRPSASSSASPASGSTLTKLQSTLNKSLGEKSPQNPQQTKSYQKTSDVAQPSANKPDASKKPSGSTDDVITLD